MYNKKNINYNKVNFSFKNIDNFILFEIINQINPNIISLIIRPPKNLFTLNDLYKTAPIFNKNINTTFNTTNKIHYCVEDKKHLLLLLNHLCYLKFIPSTVYHFTNRLF